MKVCALIVLLLLSSAHTFRRRTLTRLGSFNLTLAHQAAMEILRSCSQDLSVKTIGSIGSPDDFLSAISAELLANTLIREPYFQTFNSETANESHRKVQWVIESVWSNPGHEHKASYGSFWFQNADKILLVERKEATRCSSFDSFLIFSWRLAKNVYYICKAKGNHVYMYTFNGNNDKTPDEWKLVGGTSTLLSGSYFKRRLSKGVPCKSLFINKMLAYDRYRMSAIVEPVPHQFIFFENLQCPDVQDQLQKNCVLSPDDWKLIKGFDAIILGTIFKLMNATIQLTIDYEGTPFRYYYNYLSGKMFASKSLKTDIFLNSRDVALSLNQFPQTYPVAYREIAVVTRKRGQVTTTTRLIGLFTIGIVMSTFIILLLLVFVLGQLSGQGLGRAALNVLRFLLGMPIYDMPTGLPIRVLLGCLMSYFLISILWLQSNLAHMMTVPQTMSEANSIDDLNSGNYSMYAGPGHNEFLRFFNNPGCQLEKFNNSCPKLVLMNSQAGCIEDAEYLRREAARDQRLHVVKESLGTISTSYPVILLLLRGRINSLLLNLEESGLLGFWWRQQRENDIILENKPAAKNFTPLSFKQCAGCFYVLFGGLTLSIVVFIMELLMPRKILFGIPCGFTTTL